MKKTSRPQRNRSTDRAEPPRRNTSRRKPGAPFQAAGHDPAKKQQPAPPAKPPARRDIVRDDEDTVEMDMDSDEE